MKPRKYALRAGQTMTLYIPDPKLHAYVVAYAKRNRVSRNRALIEIITDHQNLSKAS